MLGPSQCHMCLSITPLENLSAPTDWQILHRLEASYRHQRCKFKCLPTVIAEQSADGTMEAPHVLLNSAGAKYYTGIW